MSIKVLVADDHEVVRHGLASLLSGSDIKIVAEAKDGKEAIQMARKHRPQVVLLDIRMPQSDGLETLEQLRTELPEAKVVVLSTYDNIIPPTINYEFPDPDCDLNYVPNRAVKKTVRVAISNTFGFGGHNATLLFKGFQRN